MGAPWRPRGPDDLSEDQRARIRYQVLASLRGREPTAADRLYDILAVVALPAPHLVRLALGAVLVLGVVASATVASADSLPSEPLYPVKLATEQVRLALAQSAQDRAAVQLSMAEHRLGEAERLALQGLQPEALVAGSAYGAELAEAAAELASIEPADPGAAAVVAQLTQRLAEQQGHASRVATELAGDPGAASIAPIFRTVASFAPPRSGGTTVSEAIAQHAADVAGQLAAAADEIAHESEIGSERGLDDASRAGARAPGAGAGLTPDAASPRAPSMSGTSPRGGDADTAGVDKNNKNKDRGKSKRNDEQAPGAIPAEAPGQQGAKDAAPRAERSVPALPPRDPHAARDAADRAKHEAEKAKEAAEKAKEAAEKAKAAKQRPSAHGGSEKDAKQDKGRP